MTLQESTNENGFISVDDELPMWEDGIVKCKHKNGIIYEGRFNEMGFWWRCNTANGVERFEDEITHWKKIK